MCYSDHDQSLPLSAPSDYGSTLWWNELLDLYNPASREQSLEDIISDIEYLFTTSSYWLSFINLNILVRDLNDPILRGRMQPFIMSCLAMAMLMKSSELECGSRGRALALTFRDRAQASLASACRNQEDLDYTHAEAALMLALFESSCHPLYSPDRASEALVLLDSIITVLLLTTIDQEDPLASRFPPHSAPIVRMPAGYRRPARCACIDDPSSPPSSTSNEHLAHSYSYNPPWDPRWSETEIRKEECRRLCWSALTLVSAYTAQCSAFYIEPVELKLADPANYVLLFPGEAYDRMPEHQPASGQSPKDSVWALYCRSMLLWNSCTWIHRGESLSTDERARFAIDVFQEAREIQDALDMHVCNLDTGLMYVCREYLYDTRIAITYEFRRLQDGDVSAPPPLFNRRQAEEWLLYQLQVAKRAKAAVGQLGQAAGHLLSRRPFQVSWFSNQVAIALCLWENEHSLTRALDLAADFLVPLDALIALWPCPGQASRRDELRRRLHDACLAMGKPPPPPVEANLPPILLR